MPRLLREHDDPAPSSTVVVEGRTAEEALEQVHREVGQDARILHADRVRKGGVGGFFARELVQLTVAADDDAPDGHPPEGPAQETLADVLDRRLGPGQGDAGGVAEVVADLTADVEAQEESFGAALRAALRDGDDAAPDAGRAQQAATGRPSGSDEPRADERPHWALGAANVGMSALAAGADTVEREPTTSTADPQGRPAPRTAVGPGDDAPTLGDVAPLDLDALATAVGDAMGAREPAATSRTAADGAPVEEPAPRRGGEQATAAAVPVGPWSAERLLRAGVSEGIVAEVVAAGPSDDLTWMSALVRAIEPLVRPAPYGECLYVGGRVERHVESQDDVALCRLSDEDVPDRGSLALACGPTDNAMRWIQEHARHHWLHLVVGGAGWRQWLWQDPAAVSWSAPEDLPVALGVAHMFDLPLVGTADEDGSSPMSAMDIGIAVRALLVQA